jgi:hypothetical protein
MIAHAEEAKKLANQFMPSPTMLRGQQVPMRIMLI